MNNNQFSNNGFQNQVPNNLNNQNVQTGTTGLSQLPLQQNQIATPPMQNNEQIILNQNNNINTMPINNTQNEIDPNLNKVINSNSNQFINFDNSYNETSLNNLNVDGEYNQINRPDYLTDSKVQANINAHKKNTVSISKELKTVIIITLILLVFIFIIPTIFEMINNIRFR